MADTPGIDRDALPPDMERESTSETQAPPRTVLGTLRQLGPGLIIAGSIVGSGELIATTKTGAQAGILACRLNLTFIGALAASSHDLPPRQHGRRRTAARMAQ